MEDRLEILRECYAAWNRRDVEPGLEHADPDCEWLGPPESPFAGPHRGIAQVRRFLESMLDTFEHLHRELGEPLERGDQVIVPVTSYVRGRGSGAEAQVEVIDVWTFRGEKIVRYEVLPDTPETRKGLGLEGRASHPPSPPAQPWAVSPNND